MTVTPPPASPSRFLVVTLDGRRLALNAECIWGLLTLEEAGCVEDPTIDGMAFPSINLADRLGVTKDHGGATTRVVLLSERDARGSIRVSAVHGLLELHQSQILPLPMQFKGSERHWYRGMILFEKSVAFVLNTTWVLDEQVSGVEGSVAEERAPRLAASPKSR